METQFGCWIDGKWETAERAKPLPAPYSGRVLGSVTQATPEMVQRAVAGAHRAFQEYGKWTAHERAELLYRVTTALKERREEFARLLAEEAGKPIRTARAEIDRTIATYLFAAEGAKSIRGETVPMDAAPTGAGRLGWTKRQPLGVVSAITPFNFPFNMVAHKLGPAFAVGNTVVLKPSSFTPQSALALADVFHKAGLPAGALQIVTGSGSELSDYLVTDPLVKKVTFTGSVAVGLDIKKKVGLRKVTLELGSNSALIVEPDVPYERIVKRCAEGAFGFSGQVCISLQRIYVHEEIYEAFTDAFVSVTKELVTGDPLDEATDVGAMISREEGDRVCSWIDEAVADGAQLRTGGDFSTNAQAPTILTDTKPEMKVVSREVFGPVVSVMKYRTLDEAIALVNDSEYGLNAAIYTTKIEQAVQAAEEIDAGSVIINDIPTYRVDQMPYGGVKMSGYGREGIRYAIEEMTELKFISLKPIIS